MENPNFGKKLIDVRKAKGMTQEEVAEMCNITTRTIQRIEAGAVQPRTFTIKLISEKLGFDFFETSNTDYRIEENEEKIDIQKRNYTWYIKDLFNLKTNAMRKVSILSTVIFLVGFSTFFLISEISAQSTGSQPRLNYINTEELVEVSFSNDFTLDSLIFIKEDLRARGITLNYKSLEFDDNYRLIAINAHVAFKDGNKGSFGIGALDSVNKGKRFGFQKTFSSATNSEPIFRTGSLND